jgi:branched-chain amino acid transport system ATP-binding protein
VVLSGGRVVHTGSAQEFLDDAELTQRHLGVSTDGTASDGVPTHGATGNATGDDSERPAAKGAAL